MARACSPLWPGSVRMSTSISTRSGMTFVFVPPCTTVGANVVCVHECAMRAEAERQLVDRLAEALLAASSTSGRPRPCTRRRQVPLSSGGAWYSASRRTTSAAVTSALSVRYGDDACPGVPRTVSFDQ